MNYFMLVGRLAKEIEREENKYVVYLNVKRNFKNGEGIYESDVIKIYIWEGIMINIKQTIKIGDLCGVRGYIRKDGLYVDKLTYMSCTTGKDDEIIKT